MIIPFSTSEAGILFSEASMADEIRGVVLEGWSVISSLYAVESDGSFGIDLRVDRWRFGNDV